MNRVAITGVGTINGLGHDLASCWKNIKSGVSGISTIENIPTEHLAVNIAGEVKNFTIKEDLLSEKECDRNDRFVHFALHASNEAIKDANLLTAGYPSERTGCLLGVGMGGFPIIQSTAKAYFERGPRRVSPFFIPSVIPNMASGLVCMKFGLHGTNYTVASACASSGHAISAAAMEIMLGRQDAIITGGAEAVICDMPMLGFINMKALSKWNDRATEASRPFDSQRNGFVMGEGAGVLIVENLEKAKARGAKIYAELVGFGASSDAHHITAPHPEGLGAIYAMKQALDHAGIDPSEVGYVNAHGTSTPLGDAAETNAIKEVFGEHAYNLNISSTKSMTGHLLGAASGVESIWCIKALQEGVIPPTINLEEASEECDLNYTPNKMIKKDIKYALNNSFGFGGTNSCLIFKKYEE